MRTDSLKKSDCLITFLLTALIITAACYFAGILPGGAYRAVYTDTMDQMASLSALLARQIREGGSIFYSMDTSMGQNTALLYAFCAYSPFMLLYLVIPDVYAATMVGVILRIALSAMCFHLFLRYGMRYNHRAVIFFSLCYGLCGFQYEYMMSSNLMDALYLLPIVMLCLVRAMEKERFALLSLAYTVTFCIQFYCGFVIGFFSAISLIGILLYREGWNFWKSKWRILLRYTACVLTAGLMSMFLLLPAICFFADSVGFNSLDYRVVPTLPDILYTLYFGRPTSILTYLPFLYCGLPILLILPVYFTDRQYSRKERIGAGLVLASCILTIWIDPIYSFLHAFNRPDGFTVRYAFVYVFLMVCLAARYTLGQKAANGKTISGRKYAVYFLIQICVAVALILLHDRYGEVADRKGVVFGLYGTIVFLVLWGIAGWFILRGKKEGRKLPVAILLLSAELGMQAWFNGCEQGRTTEANYLSWDKQMESFLLSREQDEKATELYRAHVGNAPYANQSAMYGYPGIAQFASSNYADLYKFMVRMGDAVSAVRYTQVGATDLTDMLLGIRYRGRLTKSEITPEEQEGPGYEVYERALPLGYMASAYVMQPIACEGNVLENQNRVLSALCGKDMQVYRPSEVISYNCENAEYVKTDSGYDIRTVSGESYGDVLFGIPEDGYKHAYAYFQLLPFTEEVTETSLQADIAENIVHYSADDRKGSGARTESVLGNAVIEMTKDGNAFVLLIGDFEKPDRVYHYAEQYFCYQEEAVLDEAYRILSSGGWNVREWRDGYVDATVNATEDMPVLFITIPYDRGWEVKVDGEPATIRPAIMNAFMAVELQPGEHQVILQYRAPGEAEGQIFSGCGVILFLFMVWKEYKERGKGKKDE